MLKSFFSLAVAAVFLASCGNNGTTAATVDSTNKNNEGAANIDGHPVWIEQGNIYEVNVRQYTPEGTFKAFSANLDRLRDMGVQTLWFMPIYPISETDRKGKLGSYYAIANYDAINPEFGNMDDWKALVNEAHSKGFKVIVDWVANHTGGDHYWLTQHPDFYVKDSITGKAISPYDWSDVRKLDYKNPVLVDTMINAMKFWITESGIDGFRCDVAGEVPKEFWSKCIGELHKVKNVFMLAEGSEPWLHEAGFDATYAWPEFQMIKKVASGQRNALAIDSELHKLDTAYPKNALRLYFTSNHDENYWNKADYGTMPGASHAPFAVLTQTLVRSVPLIYSGQEEPVMDSISFFYKNPINFGKYQRAPFYKTLLSIRKYNPAFAANASFKKLKTSNDAAIYAYERERDGNKALVVLNLSKSPVNFTWQDQPSEKEWNNVFLGNKEPVDKGFGIEPWGYAVYEKRK